MMPGGGARHDAREDESGWVCCLDVDEHGGDVARCLDG